MKPCKHLDYTEGKYTDCRIVDLADKGIPGVRYWERGETWCDYPGAPCKVQFCGAGRGRINGIFQCYQAGEMPCYEPAEVAS